MLNSKSLLKGLVLSSVMAFSQFAMADSMSLDTDMSRLSFTSIKKGTVAEAHAIQKLTGSLSDKGELKIELQLASVETNIPIRNTRMNRHVFESETNPIATITANVEGKVPTTAGVSMVEAEGELTMRGVIKKHYGKCYSCSQRKRTCSK